VRTALSSTAVSGLLTRSTHRGERAMGQAESRRGSRSGSSSHRFRADNKCQTPCFSLLTSRAVPEIVDGWLAPIARFSPSTTDVRGAVYPGAALRGCACASLCPGLTCFAPSGHGGSLTHGGSFGAWRFLRAWRLFRGMAALRRPANAVRSSSRPEGATTNSPGQSVAAEPRRAALGSKAPKIHRPEGARQDR
jgi:hypothetical protein